MPDLCHTIEDAKFTARQQRASRTKPQPWIVLKLMVFITTGIMGYTAYVYIGRFCVGIIKGERENVGAGKGDGVALLVIFCLLYIWMLWAYARVVFTPPGFARDYVSPSPPPALPPLPPPNVSTDTDTQDTLRVNGPSYEQQMSEITRPNPILDAIPPTTGKGPNYSESSNSRIIHDPRTQADLQRAEKMHITRRPPTTPVLSPEYRYCSRDLFVKPYRAHHCRACGTCVLKYDHHCPWIGQCVGARNHKFFVNFNVATAIFTAYTFATLLPYTIRSNHSPTASIDPQQIVILALSALFLLFTTTLFITHTFLLSVSQSTVESHQHQSMKERESSLLSEVFAWYEISNKRRVTKAWDREWGRVGQEGNLWWVGGRLKGWEETMGSKGRTRENPWGWGSWILPVGLNLRGKEVGMRYEVNPRFDEEGRWRKRSEWPEGVL
ncbi:DHHC palmitoyltransferase-domain-containing protein [Rhodocollybia butyracea]|uniref:Palmitoyltransferase n=1 Tax=Rhodocollybia butyracea TaxID=206335 RepID=A0A9P5PXM1_9AGAR|nr:DHHC palmitoyltransferase-domain-containing protein [Rhodocollybia butyracea]